MFDRQSKTHHRRPAVFTAKTPKSGRRVGVRFRGAEYDFETAEALSFANRIVDAAEEVERRNETK